MDTVKIRAPKICVFNDHNDYPEEWNSDIVLLICPLTNITTEAQRKEDHSEWIVPRIYVRLPWLVQCRGPSIFWISTAKISLIYWLRNSEGQKFKVPEGSGIESCRHISYRRKKMDHDSIVIESSVLFFFHHDYKYIFISRSLKYFYACTSTIHITSIDVLAV